MTRCEAARPLISAKTTRARRAPTALILTAVIRASVRPAPSGTLSTKAAGSPTSVPGMKNVRPTLFAIRESTSVRTSANPSLVEQMRNVKPSSTPPFASAEMGTKETPREVAVQRLSRAVTIPTVLQIPFVTEAYVDVSR